MHKIRILLLAASWLCIAFAGAAQAFDFGDVVKKARELAASPYKPASPSIPKEVLELNYDQLRDIRFRPERRLWSDAKLPFELAFFHLGRYYRDPVRVNEIASGAVREVKYDPSHFHYGGNKQLDPAKLGGIGYAGFRVHYPLNSARYKDEVLVFLGASYFRALGKDQVYGISARGLALDTAAPSGEEFPRFTEFWIERPAPGSKTLTIYALLDSRRAAGAYRFVLQPGSETALDVKLELFVREAGAKVGLAPLTSMFFFGENQPPPREDYRPEVHDSDGLSIHNANGEWLWRPFVNPKRLLVTSFALTDPRGFGMLQRDRLFAHYEDLEARYERRPSLWVQPKGRWGAGRVELVQLPTPNEANDNIVAYWVPEPAPAAKQAYALEYRLLWRKDEDVLPLARAVQTRRGRGHVAQNDSTLAYTVDFEGPALERALKDGKIESGLWADANAKILEQDVYPNEVSGGARMVVRLRRLDDKKPVELRAQLRTASANSKPQPLSETWSYIVPPE
jgi:glucans biosynthesis protein